MSNASDRKLQIRLALKQKRGELSKNLATGLSNKIVANFIKNVNLNSIKTVHVYQALESLGEIHTTELIEHLLNADPKIRVYSAGDKTGDVHVSLPKGEEVSLPSSFDVIIVPLVAFDKACNRIGMGGGYYDKFLAKYPQAKKIGLGYEFQKVESIPNEPHDVKLDAIATESVIYGLF